MRGHFAKANVEPKRKVVEFRVTAEAMVDVGAELSVEHFVVGQIVEIVGNTVGKGFAGVMKRHNFRGLEATHGVSISHRSNDSTGQRQTRWEERRLGDGGVSTDNYRRSPKHQKKQEE